MPAPHSPILAGPQFQRKSGANEYGGFVLHCDDMAGRINRKPEICPGSDGWFYLKPGEEEEGVPPIPAVQSEDEGIILKSRLLTSEAPALKKGTMDFRL